MIVEQKHTTLPMLFLSYKNVIKGNTDKLALSSPFNSVTFQELDQLSDLFANKIVADFQSSLIVFLKPSSHYFAALIACMKVGAIAVPIDPSLSDSHIRSQLIRVDSNIWLCDAGLKHRALSLLENRPATVICLPDQLGNGMLHESEYKKTKPSSLLHRVFTSGSSGNQTLVAFSHETMLHDAIHTSSYYGFNQETIVANLGRYTSSLGVNGFWRILLSGGTYIVFDLKTESLEQVWQRIQDSGVNKLQGQPTTIWKLFSARNHNMKNINISHLIIGGESLKHTQLADIVNALPALEKISYNYSSTETMLIAAFTASPAELLDMEKIPVGHPGADKQILIVDQQGNGVSPGETGQIVVKSKYLASEISGKDAGKRLFEDKSAQGLKIYYTGDMGRINDKGLLEHFGRADRQIKMHGLRIDPSVTENELEKIPGIERAVVVGIELSGDKHRLAAGLICRDNISDLTLIQYLSKVLPQSHIPQVYVLLDHIPQNAHGKTDLNAVQQLITDTLRKRVDSNKEFTGETSPLRLLLLSEWSKTLNEKIVNTSDSIFNHGADSISIFELTVRINSHLSTDLDPSWVLDNPSIDLQEKFLQSLLNSNPDILMNPELTPEEIRARLGLE